MGNKIKYLDMPEVIRNNNKVFIDCWKDSNSFLMGLLLESSSVNLQMEQIEVRVQFSLDPPYLVK